MIEIKPKQLKIVNEPPYLPCIYFQVPLNDDINDFKQLEGKELDGYVLTLKKKKNKSQNANSYMWVLCRKLAEKVSKGGSKVSENDIYRQAIREVGLYTESQVKAGEEKEFEKAWEKNGLGWFCELIRSTRDFTYYRSYIGSSLYDAERLGRVIDYIVDECKYHKVDTMTPLEIERLIQLWH